MELEELKHPYSYAGLIRLAILQSCDAGRHQQVLHEGGAVPARLLLLGHQPAVQPPLPLPWPRSPPPHPALVLELPPTPLVSHAPLPGPAPDLAPPGKQPLLEAEARPVRLGPAEGGARPGLRHRRGRRQ